MLVHSFFLILKLILYGSDFLHQQHARFLQPSVACSLYCLCFLTFLLSVLSPSYSSFQPQLNEDRKILLLLDAWHSWVAEKVLGMNLLLPSKTMGASTQTCLLKFKYKVLPCMCLHKKQTAGINYFRQLNKYLFLHNGLQKYLSLFHYLTMDVSDKWNLFQWKLLFNECFLSRRFNLMLLLEQRLAYPSTNSVD